MKLDSLRRHLLSEQKPKEKPISVCEPECAGPLRTMQDRPCHKCGGPRRIRKVEGALVEADCDNCRCFWRASAYKCSGCGAPISKVDVMCFDCNAQDGESQPGEEMFDTSLFDFAECQVEGGPVYVMRCLSCTLAFRFRMESGSGARCPSCGKGPIRKSTS